MNIWQVYHHYYLQRPDIGIPHVKIGIISKKQWKVADFYKRKLDSNIGNCIIILTEPTTPLIFHAQPGGTFSFMGCFMYQYPKQILTIEQQVQSYVDAGMEITSYEDVEKVLKTIGFYRLRGYSFHLYDNTTKKYVAGTKFKDIIKLYQFDQELSALLVWSSAVRYNNITCFFSLLGAVSAALKFFWKNLIFRWEFFAFFVPI